MKIGGLTLSCLLASIVAIAGLSAALPARAQNAKANIDRIVVFGTSLSDSGNAFFWLSQPANRACGTRQNVPPYDALDDLTIPDGPYAKGGHHFTNGATWVEGFARYLALAGNARPALQHGGKKASNYAVGGARAVANFPCRFNLPDQVRTYITDFPQTPPRTLVVIEIGANDVRDALEAAATSDPRPYITNALQTLASTIVQLYGHGAQKFLIVNVPDIGKTPAARPFGPAVAAFANVLARTYNDGLMTMVQGLKASGIDITVLDIYTTVNDVIGEPAQYDFSNATDACVTPNLPPFTCAQPDTYVFWDGIHPTKAMHAHIAQQAIASMSAP